MEVVPVPAPYTVLIDYAHTPDALEKVLTAARDVTQCRLLCLFGCGGDRDRTKRPVMGEIAAALADLVILTSDNPRTEDPEAILNQVAAGFPPGFTAWVRQPDRRAAIRQALSMGRAGDVILLAGKGHETERRSAPSGSIWTKEKKLLPFSNRIRYNIRSARPSPWREGGAGPKKERIEVEKRGGVREWIPF
ncbi:MAG: glutamate ligase domain-containing protein [Evtepia gabavorous]